MNGQFEREASRRRKTTIAALLPLFSAYLHAAFFHPAALPSHGAVLFSRKWQRAQSNANAAISHKKNTHYILLHGGEGTHYFETLLSLDRGGVFFSFWSKCQEAPIYQFSVVSSSSFASLSFIYIPSVVP